MARALVCCLLLICARAAAEPADDAYQEGRRLYDVHDWEGAIAKFKEAYKLRPEAKSLFNIAQSYRLKGDCPDALSFYRTYKRNYPDGPNQDLVERFLKELDPCPVKPAEPPPTGAPPQRAQPAPQQPAMKITRTHPYRTASVIVGASAALLTGGALGFELLARSTYRDSQAATGDEQLSLWHSANTKRYIADGFVLTSLAAAGVAV